MSVLSFHITNVVVYFTYQKKMLLYIPIQFIPLFLRPFNILLNKTIQIFGHQIIFCFPISGVIIFLGDHIFCNIIDTILQEPFL